MTVANDIGNFDPRTSPHRARGFFCLYLHITLSQLRYHIQHQ